MIHTLTALASGLELLTEITAAGVLLLALDRLAAAIRFTYSAGRLTGRLWFTYAVPALLMAADGISWLNSQIDWCFALGVTRDGLVAVAVALYLAGQHAKAALIGASERIGALYAAALVGSDQKATQAAPKASQAAPMIHPLATLADDLLAMTASEIRALSGSRRRVAKAQLVAAYVVA